MRRATLAAPLVALLLAAPAVARPVAGASSGGGGPTADIEARPTGGTEAQPTDGTEAQPTDGTEAQPTDGTEAQPTDGTEAQPTDGTEARSPAVPRITARGVGQVKLGMRFGELRDRGLVGRLRPGCELAPDQRIARLRSPLRGSVTFVDRKAKQISVVGGARARGVRIGDRIRDIRDAYPRATVDRSTEGTFGITLVRVPKRGGGSIQFAVPVDTGEIDLIAVPVVAFCE